MHGALDYKTARPPLRPEYAAKVRRVLARVNPCQRPLVYYAYPSDVDNDYDVAIFFKGPAYNRAHVLDGGNTYFDEVEGTVFPTPAGGYDYSLAADVRNEKCTA
jgi:hypothetical protein